MSTRRRSSRGAAAVEFALMAPVLILFLGAVIDFGLAFVTQAQLQEAAEEGAIAAAREPDNPATARQRAVDAVSIVDLSPSEVVVECLSPSRVRVAVEHQQPNIVLGAVLDGPMAVRADMISDVLSDSSCVAAP